jgi:hypothetical protein
LARSKFSGLIILSTCYNNITFTFLQAIDLILEEWLMSLKPSNFALACFVYTSSRDVLKAVSMMDENQIAVPSKLLFSIKQNGGNLAEALDTVIFLKM